VNTVFIFALVAYGRKEKKKNQTMRRQKGVEIIYVSIQIFAGKEREDRFLWQRSQSEFFFWFCVWYVFSRGTVQDQFLVLVEKRSDKSDGTNHDASIDWLCSISLQSGGSGTQKSYC